MEYYNSKVIKLSFDAAIEKTTEELKNEGFGVLTEIDVKETLKKKLNVDFRKYKILGACNPPFAYTALQSEPRIGVLLPCNVIVQELDSGNVEISAVNPLVAMSSVNNPALSEVAAEVSNRLDRVLNNL